MADPTMIDRMVMELGLDTTKFSQGVRDALDALKKTRDASIAIGSDIELYTNKMSRMFTVAKEGALGLIGAFAGVEIAGFISNVLTMDAATGRLAHSIGQSTENLSKWEGMVRMIGGSAGDAQHVFAGVTDAINTYMATTGMPPVTFMALLNRIPGMRMDQFTSRDPNVVNSAWEKVSGFAANENARQPGMGRWWLEQIPGMTQAFMNLLLLGPDRMKKLNEQISKMGYATELTADQAIDFQIKTTALDVALQNLGREGFPIVIWVVDQLTDTLKKLKEVWQDIKTGNWSKLESDTTLLTGKEALEGAKKVESATDILQAHPFGIPVKPGAGEASYAMKEVESALSGLSGIKEITALADHYHQGFDSAHNQGRALDLTINDPAKSAAMASAIEAALTAKGIKAKVLNEYMHPSAHATGGHIHVEVANPGYSWFPSLATPPTAVPGNGWGKVPTTGNFGIPGAGAAAAGAVNSTSNMHSSSVDVSIGTVAVYTQATDAEGLTRDTGAALRKNLAVAMNYNSSMTG